MRTKISKFLYNQIVDSFAKVIADLKDSDEAEFFLKDFLTKNELETLSKRLTVAYWLKKKRSHKNIITNLKVSGPVVNEIVQMAKKKGFLLGLTKMEAEEWANKWAVRIQKFIKK